MRGGRWCPVLLVAREMSRIPRSVHTTTKIKNCGNLSKKENVGAMEPPTIIYLKKKDVDGLGCQKEFELFWGSCNKTIFTLFVPTYKELVYPKLDYTITSKVYKENGDIYGIERVLLGQYLVGFY